MGHKTVPHHPFIVSRKYFISREHLSDGEMYHTPARISPHRDLQISPSPSQASLSSLHCSFTWHRRRPAKSSSHSLPQQNKSEEMNCAKCELDIAEVRACFYSGLRVYLSVSYVTQNVIARGALSWPGQLLSPPSLSQVLVPAHSPDREKKLAPKLTQDRTWAGILTAI